MESKTNRHTWFWSVDKDHAEVFIPFCDSDDPDVAASEVLEMSAGKNHCYDNASIPIVTEA